MRSIVGLWRWRNNPLYRRSDRREAWLALCAIALIVVCAPLLGLFGAATAHDALLRTVREEHHDRHQVWATAQSVRSRVAPDPDPESATQHAARRHVVAQWAGPDGRSHRGTVGTDRPVRAGDSFRIWTDRQGRLTARPVSARTASSHAALAGIAAGVASAAAVEAARRLTVRQSMRRQYLRWGEEWDRIGPDWGRTGTNS